MALGREQQLCQHLFGTDLLTLPFLKMSRLNWRWRNFPFAAAATTALLRLSDGLVCFFLLSLPRGRPLRLHLSPAHLSLPAEQVSAFASYPPVGCVM